MDKKNNTTDGTTEVCNVRLQVIQVAQLSQRGRAMLRVCRVCQ